MSILNDDVFIMYVCKWPEDGAPKYIWFNLVGKPYSSCTYSLRSLADIDRDCWVVKLCPDFVCQSFNRFRGAPELVGCHTQSAGVTLVPWGKYEYIISFHISSNCPFAHFTAVTKRLSGQHNSFSLCLWVEHIRMDSRLSTTLCLVRVWPVPRGPALWPKHASGGEPALCQPIHNPFPEAFSDIHWPSFYLCC